MYMKLYILNWVLDVVDEYPYKRMSLAYYYNTKRILKVEAFKYSWYYSSITIYLKRIKGAKVLF